MSQVGKILGFRRPWKGTAGICTVFGFLEFEKRKWSSNKSAVEGAAFETPTDSCKRSSLADAPGPVAGGMAWPVNLFASRGISG
jgi:hypothetical protein